MRIKTIIPAVIIILSVLKLHPAVPTEGMDLFPAVEGFSVSGKMETYTPDTLFEYINGGADLFLNFEFVRLHSLKYVNGKGGEITADIYIHADLPNGFGIYTQERPEEGDFIETGTEGYYEEGTLNFFKGPAYVKLSSFDLGENEESILKKLAEGISGNISHPAGYPALFTAFPTESAVKGTDKFINLNFLGHSFLNRVYSRDYSVNGKTVRLFVIRGTVSGEPEKILADYTGFIKGKGGEIKKEGNVVTFSDPYYRREGRMNILISGDTLVGMFSDDPALFINSAEYFLKKMNSMRPPGRS